MTLRAVLLDVDGTLIDSNDAHARAWVETLAEFERPVPFDEIRRMIGKGGEKILWETVQIAKESELGVKVSERRAQLFREQYLPKLKPFPGTQALLRHMHDQQLRLVVATSAREEEMNGLLQIAGADGLLYERTSASEAERSKPDPDIIEAALAKAGCSAQEALMIGDTPYDVEAAARAGLRSLAFRCGGWDDAALSGAIAIYDGPAQLLERYATSPLTS